MQQPLGDFNASFQSAGENLHQVAAAVGQAQAPGHLFDALSQRGAGQPVQVPLPAQILFHGELLVQTLRLEDNADASAALRPARVLRHARRSAARPSLGAINVERMRNSVDFPPPFGPSRPKISPSGTPKLTPDERDPLAVSVGQIFDRNDHRLGRSSSIRP